MNRGRGGFSGRGGARNPRQNDNYIPDYVEPAGTFLHLAEGDMVAKSITRECMLPYFNAVIYREDKKPIGKVDEIFGGINDVHFSIKPFGSLSHFNDCKPGMEVYIASEKLLPLARFLPKPVEKIPPPKKKRSKGGVKSIGFVSKSASGGRGGFGGNSMGASRGGRGGPSRGGNNNSSFGGSRGGNSGGRGGFGGGRGFNR